MLSSGSIAKGDQREPIASHAARRFGTAALGALSYRRLLGANDRVQVGFIGYGLIGAQHVFDFKNQKDVDLAAMCDVYQPRLEQGVAACGQARQALFRLPQACSTTRTCRPSSSALPITGTP